MHSPLQQPSNSQNFLPMPSLNLNLNLKPLLRNTTTSLFKPNPLISSSLKDIVKVLKLSADSKNLNLGKIIHAQLIITNQVSENNLIQVNSLINFYAKSGKIAVGRQLFDQMRERNVVSWSALMAGCLHNGFTLEVIELFRNMLLMDNVRPNEYILATVLSGCCERGAVNLGRQTHGYAVKSGLLFHQYVKNALIYLYSMNLDAKLALQILNSVPGFDNSSYNSIIKGFLEQGCLMEAVKILFRMVEDCVPWDKVTYVSAFGLCASLKNLRWGMQVHCYAMKMNVEFDVFVSSAVIDMYGKCGRARYARTVFDGLEDQNVVCWTAVMGAYLQNAYFEEAINLLCEMDASDIQPNDYTLAVLLNCCAGLSALKHGELLHARAEKLGFRDHVIVANALINMYAKSGNIKAANRVFSHMSYRDLVTWNSMISGYSHHGLGREALAVFYDMLTADEPPNYVTFVGVLAACGHLGLVEEGFYYLNHLMKQNGVKPGLEHYTCILGLLCRAGKLHAAQEFMNSSPVQWDVIAWRTLLNACHIHRDFAVGKQVAEVVLQMDPNDVGTHILLSNMYARAKRWDGVVKIRKLIRERSIKKEPGASWIEIKNNVHVFVSEDNKHAEHVQIYEKVMELLKMIKPLGYIPDIAQVFHDVEDEQKEGYLSCHSEKLAVAYGLMKTPAAAEIRVIKNLRICDDCHSFVKLVSKVTNRVIIVRDANRFHSFQDGECSCADYW